MSTFYRRDLVTDQKLEKRLETEADLVGGKIPLGQLPNEVATKEYVDQTIGGSSIPLFIAVNVDGNLAYSNDGDSWTIGQRLTYSGENLTVERVSIAKDYIIYLGGISYFNQRLYYAASYETPETQLISFPSTYLGVTGIFAWRDIKFGGEYTVAVGNFVPAEGNEDTRPVPVWAYTIDGISWTLGSVDPGYYEFANDAAFTSVEYNGIGWLFVASRFSSNEEMIDGAGAFFTTNLSAQLTESNFIYYPNFESSEEVNWNIDSVVWTGNRWWLKDSDEDGTDSLGYFVSSGANPLTSTWTLVNPAEAARLAGFGEGRDFYEDAGGAIYSNYWFAAANSHGQVIASSDGGQTWITSVPKPYTGTVSLITNDAESTITFGEGNSPRFMAEKIIISNAVPSSFNGTYFIDTDTSKLYLDVDLETPFNTAAMGEFVSATATFSHGQFLDSFGFGLGKFIAGNDDEELFKSTNLQTWIEVLTPTEEDSFDYWNDIDFNAEWGGSSIYATRAYVNQYVEAEIAAIPLSEKADLVDGKVPSEQLPEPKQWNKITWTSGEVDIPDLINREIQFVLTDYNNGFRGSIFISGFAYMNTTDNVQWTIPLYDDNSGTFFVGGIIGYYSNLKPNKLTGIYIPIEDCRLEIFYR